MKISDFQDLLKELYLQNDLNRGVNSTFIWLIEEIGELATLLNSIDIDKKKVSEEIADIIAWTISIANILEIDIEKALSDKYPNKCKKCSSSPCTCEK
ncbi:MAG: MazG nucleotide pyrophosphohydrolase domain-containing protein [Promethearchaeota archaeon]|jgi:NTP pyrophosphatase (non-canonical NTP hydrolase)